MESDKEKDCKEEGICSCHSNKERKEPLLNWKRILIICSSVILLGAGLFLELYLKEELISQILFLFVVIISGYNIIKTAFLSIIKFRFNMSVLMTLAGIGSFLIGHGEEGATVMFLFFIAEFLEEYASERAKKSIEALLKISPTTAIVLNGKREVVKKVEEIEVNEIILVKPGDIISLDGTIINGSSSINESSITGESIPINKSKGDLVYAGTINEDSYLEIKVTKKSNETVIYKIVKMVEEAKKQKSNTELFVDKFTKIYTPVVIVLAILTLIIPTWLFGQSFDVWFYRALVLLVVSCPCAMAISTPVSIVSALTSGAKNGVIIKGGRYIEEIKREKVIAFDKTGTLTEGKPKITDIVSLNNYKEDELLSIVASLESRSNHPLGIPLINEAKLRKITIQRVSNFKSYSGKGLEGKVKTKTFYAGSKRFFEELNIKMPDKVIELESKGKTLILIGEKNKIIGIVALMDKIKDNAKEVIKDIKLKGIRTVILTGDNKRVAKAIADELGVDEYYFELLPQDKVKIIEELLKKYEHVVMIGDGVNDAPALAKAHVGIAMSETGTDVAIETANIVLMKDDLSKIPYLIDLSNKTMKIVRQNVTASILIKGSFAILAFPGIMPLWLAVAIGDMGLTLGVILNSLRIGRVKKNKDNF